MLGLGGGLGAVIASGGGAVVGAQPPPPPAPNTALGQVYTPGEAIAQPFVLPTKTLDYLYSSGAGSGPNVPLRTYTKVGQWSPVLDAMPTLPSWVEPGTSVTSPDVRLVAGHYVMWFSAVTASAPPGFSVSHIRCLGWAQSASPTGPFTDPEHEPAVCREWDNGDANPHTFMDGTQEYLLWNSQAYAVRHSRAPTWLYSEKLAADGTTLEGAPAHLIKNTKPWEGPVVSSPTMVADAGHYDLFFTGSLQSLAQVGVGLATCETPSGPCRDALPGPWLGSSIIGEGPGLESVFAQNGALWLAYSPRSAFYSGASPELAISRVALDGEVPYVADFDGLAPEP